MRTYAFDEATDPIAFLVTITRVDEEQFFLTTWPQSIRVSSSSDATTWVPGVGLKIYDIAERNDATPASSQISLSVYSGGLIDPDEVAYDMFSEATVLIEVVNPLNPVEPDFHFYGKIGNKTKPVHDVVTFELVNPYGIPRVRLVPQYTPMCRHAFGNVFSFCQMPVMQPHMARGGLYAVGNKFRFLTGSAPTGYGNAYFEVTAITTGITAAVAPAFNYTPGSTTVDGGVTWTARNAWERACTIATIVDRHTIRLSGSPDPRSTVDGWYGPGMIMPVTGRNKNRVFQIGLWTASTLQLTSYRPIGAGCVVGDTALIWPDCDKTLEMCVSKYSNGANYGGFPYYEGAKAASLVSG